MLFDEHDNPVDPFANLDFAMFDSEGPAEPAGPGPRGGHPKRESWWPELDEHKDLWGKPRPIGRHEGLFGESSAKPAERQPVDQPQSPRPVGSRNANDPRHTAEMFPPTRAANPIQPGESVRDAARRLAGDAREADPSLSSFEARAGANREIANRMFGMDPGPAPASGGQRSRAPVTDAPLGQRDYRDFAPVPAWAVREYFEHGSRLPATRLNRFMSGMAAETTHLSSANLLDARAALLSRHGRTELENAWLSVLEAVRGNRRLPEYERAIVDAFPGVSLRYWQGKGDARIYVDGLAPAGVKVWFARPDVDPTTSSFTLSAAAAGANSG